jgi:hypothetical protein
VVVYPKSKIIYAKNWFGVEMLKDGSAHFNPTLD